MPIVERRTFILLCIVAIVARLALTLTSAGSNDAYFNTMWVQMAQQHGIVGAYHQTSMMNHPPLSLVLMLLYSKLGTAVHMPYIHVFRFFQIAADGLSAFALYSIGSRANISRGRALALFVLLSPAAAFISGFHCNSDPMMIALVVSAGALLLSGRTAAAGTTLALASGIKILPFLLVPLFLLSLRREKRLKFVLAFGAVAAVIFIPVIVLGGPMVARHIFGYGGGPASEWGFPGLAFAASRLIPGMRDVGEWLMVTYMATGRYIVYVTIALVILLVMRRSTADRNVLPACAVMFLAILAVAPGFGVQYTAWLIPLLPFALSWRGALAVNLAASIFLFVTYTLWSGEWPWWMADIGRHGPYRWVAALAGYLMWAVVCAALVSAVRRYQREHPRQTQPRMPIEELLPARGSH